MKTIFLSEQRFTSLSITILILAAGWIWISRLPSGMSALGDIAAPRPSFKAPEFSLDSSTGEMVTLSEQQDKVILVNFWTSWCPPCRAEMPAIQRVYQDYKEDGLIVLGINATDQDDIAAVQLFVRENQLTFPILFDRDGEISRLYNLHSLPTSYFIDQDGIIQDVVVGGPMAETLLRTRVERLLEVSK